MNETTKETLTEKARELRRAYKREWSRKNRDRVRAANERYWNKKAAQEEQAEQKTPTP